MSPLPILHDTLIALPFVGAVGWIVGGLPVALDVSVTTSCFGLSHFVLAQLCHGAMYGAASGQATLSTALLPLKLLGTLLLVVPLTFTLGLEVTGAGLIISLALLTVRAYFSTVAVHRAAQGS